MKKLFLLLILCFYLTSCVTVIDTEPTNEINNPAKANKDIKIIYSSPDEIYIMKNSATFVTSYPWTKKPNKDFIKTALNHCELYKKNSYHFFKQADPGANIFSKTYAFSKEDLYSWSLLQYKNNKYEGYRFVCANSSSEARYVSISQDIQWYARSSGSVFVEHTGSLKYIENKRFISEQEIAENKKKEEKRIAENPKDEPKKKEPKPILEDDKIVPAGSGSGFIVSKDGTVITNYHVIEGCELNKVTYKGSQLEAKVLSIDKVNDIAILKTNISSDTAFAVSNEDVSLLEDVVVAGFPLGKQISSAIKTHKGVVTALAGAGDNYSFFQTDAAINQGNSGGPIINKKGNVIGIAVQTWVEEGVQGVHFGIKSSTLKTFASANGLKFLAPNNRDLSNKELGKLITESTVYVECHMTIAKIKKMIAEAENKKAFFKDYQ